MVARARPAWRDRSQAWEAFFKRALLALRIPDEMRDAERGEFLAAVPSRQAVDRSSRFILPDASSYFKSLSIGELDRLRPAEGGSIDSNQGKENPHTSICHARLKPCKARVPIAEL